MSLISDLQKFSVEGSLGDYAAANIDSIKPDMQWELVTDPQVLNCLALGTLSFPCSCLNFLPCSKPRYLPIIIEVCLCCPCFPEGSGSKPFDCMAVWM